MITKEKLYNLIDHLPTDFSTDDVIEQIILLQKIDRAEEEIANGEGEDWEDVKREMDTW